MIKTILCRDNIPVTAQEIMTQQSGVTTFLVGRPGIGKTPFLNDVAMATRSNQTANFNNPKPTAKEILARLDDCPSGISILLVDGFWNLIKHLEQEALASGEPLKVTGVNIVTLSERLASLLENWTKHFARIVIAVDIRNQLDAALFTQVEQYLQKHPRL